MHYSRDEEDWLDRKAAEIARQTGWPLPIARAEAQAELVRIRERSKAKVIPLDQGRLMADSSA